MINSEIRDYWRWRLIRQVSEFVNDPRAENTHILIDMIEAYPAINRELELSGHTLTIEPPPAEFVCSVDN